MQPAAALSRSLRMLHRLPLGSELHSHPHAQRCVLLQLPHVVRRTTHSPGSLSGIVPLPSLTVCLQYGIECRTPSYFNSIYKCVAVRRPFQVCAEMKQPARPLHSPHAVSLPGLWQWQRLSRSPL